MFDLVIRNGTVVDGTGAKPFTADVGVKDGRIAAVGANLGEGTREIDATGFFVTPGWVDVHTHYDGQVTWDPELSPSGTNGVTTMVMGNCGVGFAPVRPGQEEFLIKWKSASFRAVEWVPRDWLYSDTHMKKIECDN